MKNVLEFQIQKNNREKITMITCYDYSFAKIIDQTDIDTLLIGDSVAQVIHGHTNTLSATTNMIAMHTKAVRRGTNKFIVADMPFLSTRKGLKHAMDNVHQLMTAGANAIKIEGCKGHTELIQHIVESGVPVMGHLGLTPQSIHQLGGPKIQGRSDSQAKEILEDALHLERSGCFSVVLECIPEQLAKIISGKLKIPVIGIGAGPHCDGQVLVLQDMLGMNADFNPKFLKKYSNLHTDIKSALNNYVSEVKSSLFPKKEHSYE
jgi:3-methyl-2-oxobutanoate hydroxymethyltransferase